MILWKNVWYNLVIRQWHLLKYYWKGQHKDSYYPLPDWGRWYYPYKQSWTKKQEDRLYAELEAAAKKLKFQKPVDFAYHVYHDSIISFPISHHPNTGQQPNTPRNCHEDDANGKTPKDA